MTASGSPAEYTAIKLEKIAVAFALRFNVAASDVTVTALAGSVILIAEIRTPSSFAASKLTQVLSVALATAEDATSFFEDVTDGIIVLETPSVEAISETTLTAAHPPSHSLPPSLPSASSDSSFPIILVLVLGGTAVWTLFFAALLMRRGGGCLRASDKVAPSMSSKV